MSGGSPIRRRLLVSFMLLAAGLGLTMGMVGLLSYDRLGAHLVDWYARPVMNALIEAEERSRRAEDRGRHNNLVYGADLANLMDLQFRVGKQIPREWHSLEPGLHFFDRMENFVFLEEHKGVRYALSGHTGLLVTIKAQLTRVLGLCAGLGLGVAALLAVLLVGLYGVVRYLRQRGRGLGSLFRPAPPLPPHVEAIKALETLHNQKLWQNSRYKAYYSGLSDILRHYIVRRWNIGALEMTSDEIIEAMRGVELPDKARRDLSSLLRDADLVKFAKAEPDSEQNENDYLKSYYFVEETKPVVEPAEGEKPDTELKKED